MFILALNAQKNRFIIVWFPIKNSTILFWVGIIFLYLDYREDLELILMYVKIKLKVQFKKFCLLHNGRDFQKESEVNKGSHFLRREWLHYGAIS